MTLVIFSWATTQKYCREIVSHDLRKQLQLETMNQDADDVLPAPIIDDGLENPYFFEDGDFWQLADDSKYVEFMQNKFLNM